MRFFHRKKQKMMKTKFVLPLLAILAFGPCAQAQLPKAQEAKILERFPQADADGDGKLSPAEQKALSKKIMKRYPEADTDGDGQLSPQESQALMRKSMARNNDKPTPQTSKGNSGKPTPDHANVKYGEHERNVFDLWLAESDKPTPLAIYIHGGGFKSGSKEKFKSTELEGLLKAGISVASISYRLVPAVRQPTPYHDAQRALQFMRSKAGEWNIDKDRVAVFGGSAGAQICMWLAYSDEMANPDSEDPVERESTRVTCVATSGGQTSMEGKFLEKHMSPILGEKYSMLEVLGRGQSQEEQIAGRLLIWNAKTLEEADAGIKKHSALNLISRDDPPIFMRYGMAPDAELPDGDLEKLRGWLIHHSFFGVELKKKADSLKVENHLSYRGAECDYDSTVEFFQDKLFPNGD